MLVKTVPTFTVTLWMAGDVRTARAWLRRQCTLSPLCVTVTETELVYAGGHEAGFAVGLVNYPRFPSAPEGLLERAKGLAVGLMEECGQHSALLVTPMGTTWLTSRKENGA
jgi:hypothetical protein